MTEYDESIKMAADVIFKKYDRDLNGYLDPSEVTALIIESRKKIGSDEKVTKKDLDKFFSFFNPAVKDMIANH